jgi:hypothetical protein
MYVSDPLLSRELLGGTVGLPAGGLHLRLRGMICNRYVGRLWLIDREVSLVWEKSRLHYVVFEDVKSV